MMRGAAVLLLVGGCWADRPATTGGTVRATRPQTREERLSSISIPQIEADLRAGRLASYGAGPLVVLDLDTGALRVQCGDAARRVIDEISASFSDPARAKPTCPDTGQYGYEVSCGQMVVPPGKSVRDSELRTVDLLVDRGGEVRLESATITVTGNAAAFAYLVHEFRQAKQHARCPP